MMPYYLHVKMTVITFLSLYMRGKCWIRENFRHPVFDGLTCFEMSLTHFDHFWKMPVCLSVCLYVCLQNFVDIVSQELMRGN